MPSSALPVSPDGSLPYAVTVICNGPVVGAQVEVRFNAVGDTLVCWCNSVPGPRPHSFWATTDASGVAVFHIPAGGCVMYGAAAIPGSQKYVAEVFVYYGDLIVKVQECGIVSPDACDAAGRRAIHTSSAWDPAGACGVGLSDAVYHTTPISTSTYDWCTDINGDRMVGLSDATILTPYLAAGTSCAGDAGP
jgi:hypothetical protein